MSIVLDRSHTFHLSSFVTTATFCNNHFSHSPIKCPSTMEKILAKKLQHKKKVSDFTFKSRI